jgi:hypothetical protein
MFELKRGVPFIARFHTTKIAVWLKRKWKTSEPISNARATSDIDENDLPLSIYQAPTPHGLWGAKPNNLEPKSTQHRPTSNCHPPKQTALPAPVESARPGAEVAPVLPMVSLDKPEPVARAVVLNPGQPLPLGVAARKQVCRQKALAACCLQWEPAKEQ